MFSVKKITLSQFFAEFPWLLNKASYCPESHLFCIRYKLQAAIYIYSNAEQK